MTIGIDFTVAQHAEFHHNASNAVDYPHTFFFYPVYEKVADFSSNIVAIITGAIAWDASLNNLLPQNVGGLLVTIYNDCNQTYQFELDGEEAFYLGEGVVIPNSYPGMELDVSLSLYTNDAFNTTPGHCLYSMVR